MCVVCFIGNVLLIYYVIVNLRLHIPWFDMCWIIGVVGLEWYPFCASACKTDTTPTPPHRNSNTHRTKNNTTNVVIQQNSRKLLMMDILMSETCWAHKKWNNIASDIKLVFYSSTYIVVCKIEISFLYSWVKRDQLDATCFIITLFSAQHVSDVNTSILRSLWQIRWVSSWVVSGSMCIGVTLQCGYGGVVSVCSSASVCIRMPHHPSQTTT